MTVPADAPDRALLEQRARRLAAPVRVTSDASRQLYLAFTLHGERFAVEATLVCGAFRFVDFAPLPGAGAEVVGVTLWRGSFLRIVDLARILGGSRAGLDDRAMVVALGVAAPRCGLLVSELASVGPLSVADGSATLTRAEGEFVQHVTADAVQILDGHTLISTFG